MRLRVLTPGGQEGVKEPSSQKGDIPCLGGQLLAKMPLHTQEGVEVGDAASAVRPARLHPTSSLNGGARSSGPGNHLALLLPQRKNGVGRGVNDLTGYQGKA